MPASEGFLSLPQCSGKPRTKGITHVIDKSLTLGGAEGLFESAGDYVDVVKLGWGTSYVTCAPTEGAELASATIRRASCGQSVTSSS